MQSLHKGELQEVHGIGECFAFRFTQQKVNVYGHHHISVDEGAELNAHVFQTRKELVIGDDRLETGLAMITTESEEMRLAGVVLAAQSAGHERKLNPDGYGRL